MNEALCGPVRPWLVLAALAASGVAAARDGAQASPKRFDLERFHPQAVRIAAENGQPVSLDYFGATHELLLEPSSVRSERLLSSAGSLGEVRRTFLPAAATFRGRLAGDPDSHVRLSVTRHGLRGYIRSRDGWTFIEPHLPAGMAPAQVADTETPEHKVFTDADLDPDFIGHCADAVQIDPSLLGQPSPAFEARGPRTAEDHLRVLEMAIDADAEFASIYGNDSATEIESIINMVDGIYEAELGLSLEIVWLNVWESEPDPYSSTESATLLTEMRSHWNANRGGVSRDVAHLFTGKDLNGSTVGIAYVSVVCSTSVAYGLSQDLGSDALMPLLVAHEVGHNLGANHDPSTSTTRYIMYPSLGFSTIDEFSDQSGTEIGNYVDSVSCLAVGSHDGGGDPPPDNGGGNGGNGSGGGGGGGGPVDPFLLAFLGAAGLARLGRRAPGAGR